MTLRVGLPSVLLAVTISCCFGPIDSGSEMPPPPAVDISLQELTDIGRSLEECINSRTFDSLDAMVNRSAQLERIVWPYKPSSKDVRAYSDNVEKSLGESIFGNWIRNNGTVHFLRARRNDRGTTLLFRMSNSVGDFNYVEFLLGGAAGRPDIVDLYFTSIGEYLSRSTRHLIIGDEHDGILERLTKATTSSARARQFREADVRMGTLIDSGRFRECLDYFESLPESLKGEKVLQLQHLRAALGTGDPGPCKRAMADFRSIVAHGPSLDQNLIAVYLVLENFDSALIAVDGLNQYVDDPYLDIQRSLIFLKAGNYSASRSAAEKVIATDPMLPTAYVVLMTVGIRQHGNVLISDALDRMQRCGAGTIDFEGIESSLEYAEFAASSEYEALKRKYH